MRSGGYGENMTVVEARRQGGCWKVEMSGGLAGVGVARMGSTWYENGTGNQEPGTHPDPQLSPPSLADPLTKQSPGPSDLAPTRAASVSHLLSPPDPHVAP